MKISITIDCTPELELSAGKVSECRLLLKAIASCKNDLLESQYTDDSESLMFAMNELEGKVTDEILNVLEFVSAQKEKGREGRGK